MFLKKTIKVRKSWIIVRYEFDTFTQLTYSVGRFLVCCLDKVETCAKILLTIDGL